MSNLYRAVKIESPSVSLYLADAGDPEVAIEEASFTENPTEAQFFEGKGWANAVAGLGAVLEIVP